MGDATKEGHEKQSTWNLLLSVKYRQFWDIFCNYIDVRFLRIHEVLAITASNERNQVTH